MIFPPPDSYEIFLHARLHRPVTRAKAAPGPEVASFLTPVSANRPFFNCAELKEAFAIWEQDAERDRMPSSTGSSSSSCRVARARKLQG